MCANFKNYLKVYPFPTIKQSIKAFEQLIYPLKCLKCGTYIDPDFVEPDTIEACFCDVCMKADLYPIIVPYCIQCGVKFQKPLNNNSNQGYSGNHACQACIKTPLRVDKVRAAFEYRGIMKDAIPLFKYSSKLAVARVFEYFLFQTFLQHYEKSDINLIIPMPLHKSKLRERGFNQVFLIIRNFEKLYQLHFQTKPLWEIDTTTLARIKKTTPQTGFDIEQRKNNLKKAFKVLVPDRIKNKNILLIDDVFTTGATCNEAALELIESGADRVEALVLART
jgi:ComF family protein